MAAFKMLQIKCSRSRSHWEIFNLYPGIDHVSFWWDDDDICFVL